MKPYKGDNQVLCTVYANAQMALLHVHNKHRDIACKRLCKCKETYSV